MNGVVLTECKLSALHLRASLQRHRNVRVGGSNHWRLDWLLNRVFRRRSKKTSKLRVTGLCAGNSPMTGEFPTHRASHMENVSIWWRLHIELTILMVTMATRAARTVSILNFGLGGRATEFWTGARLDSLFVSWLTLLQRMRSFSYLNNYCITCKMGEILRQTF